MRFVSNKPKGEVLAIQATYSLDVLFCGVEVFSGTTSKLNSEIVVLIDGLIESKKNTERN